MGNAADHNARLPHGILELTKTLNCSRTRRGDTVAFKGMRPVKS